MSEEYRNASLIAQYNQDGVEDNFGYVGINWEVDGVASTKNPFILQSNGSSLIRNQGKNLSVAKGQMNLNTKSKDNYISINVVENDPKSDQFITTEDARMYFNALSYFAINNSSDWWIAIKSSTLIADSVEYVNAKGLIKFLASAYDNFASGSLVLQAANVPNSDEQFFTDSSLIWDCDDTIGDINFASIIRLTDRTLLDLNSLFQYDSKKFNFFLDENGASSADAENRLSQSNVFNFLKINELNLNDELYI